MPKIYDNIVQDLLPPLRETLRVSDRADFCVGYFNLRGWRQVADLVDEWSGGAGHCCRVLVGMHRSRHEEVREALRFLGGDAGIDSQTAVRLKRRLAQEFREQLMAGVPTASDEAGLRCLAGQLRAGKVVVRLFLRHLLHAKLYLLVRPDPLFPLVGYLGSSNLTLAGLSRQGELNVDVTDQDACRKLERWFEDRWDDRWCVDISMELADIIDESWARATPVPPYHIYLKMAFHLSQEARAGVSEFRIPRDFGRQMFAFQVAAAQIAAHHLNKRGGVLIGDVVGLGKTLMATAVARIFEDDFDLETLIICPKNLVAMWEDYRTRYRLRGKVLSMSRVEKDLPDLRRYRLVVIDESHNLRNREGKRYRVIQDYLRANESKVVLLTATPYNKTYLDLANQLRLFLPEDQDIGIRPERLLREIGETTFAQMHQCAPRSLAAFEKSEYADDWREVMRLYMVRRTRTFILANYAETDADGRRFLTFTDGRRMYFPIRQPRTVTFDLDEQDPEDQYARLYSDPVVDAVNALCLPRYGLGNYIEDAPRCRLTDGEAEVVADLSRAGKRLMGFCRTNLFKRLESSGHAFWLSVDRHILRNHVYLHALANGLPVPIGTQDAVVLDARLNDEDTDWLGDDGAAQAAEIGGRAPATDAEYAERAAEIYRHYASTLKTRFKWLPAATFKRSLAEDLAADARALQAVLRICGAWRADRDAKLRRLVELATVAHPGEKLLVFSQFADTVDYLARQLTIRGVPKVAGVTGDANDPTTMAWRFSPVSNEKRTAVPPERELDVLIATDVLSEGQNLQDAAIVVNYDLPWAIIRLIQRAGRVDRIGQSSETITCYSFVPADGVERLIRLRDRVRRRLRENAEVVGTDESFFEDDRDDQVVRDLFTEKAGILDDEDDSDVDLGSYALQIWRNAVQRDRSLERVIPELPNVVNATKPHDATVAQPDGALVYVRTAQDNDALVWIGPDGRSVTESQFAVLRAAECKPGTPALPRRDDHHELVQKSVALVAEEERTLGGQLGKPSGARFRTYVRLKQHAEALKGTVLDRENLRRTIDDIYHHPLREMAIDTLNRMLRSGVSDEDLAARAIALREEDRLCVVHDEEESVDEPRIICSMGLGPSRAGGGA